MNQFGSDSSLETPEMSTDLIDIISKSREIYGILDIWRCLMEKAMVPHSSTLATPVLLPSSWAEEPGRLQSMGSLRVGHDWGLHFHFSLSCIGEGNGNPPVFLPGESQGRGSLVGCRLWGCTESDTTEVT